MDKIKEFFEDKLDTLQHMFHKSMPPVVGIDIGGTSVKLIELHRHGSRYEVTAFANEVLPFHAVHEREIKEVTQVGDCISKAYRRSHPTTTNAATSVSGSAVISKIIQLPASLAEDEIESQIELEAGRHIPYSMDEVSIDFEVIGPAQDPSMVDILLAGCRTDNIDNRVDVLDMAGFKAKIVDIEVYALERAMNLLRSQIDDYDNKTVALVDLGTHVSTLNVFREGKIVYSRDQVFGGYHLIEEIQRHYDMSYDEAIIARDDETLPDSYKHEILPPFLSTTAEQIDRAIQFFMSSTHFDSIDVLVLAGGVAILNGLEKVVEQNTQIKTIKANPFKDISFSPKVNKADIEKHAPALLIACGLALRSFE